MPPRRKGLEEDTVGGRVYTLRVANSLTQQELAEQMGVDRSYIAQIETGHYLPGLDALQRLATHFQVTIEFLQHGDGLPYNKSRFVEDPEALALLSLWDRAPTPARSLILRMLRAVVDERSIDILGKGDRYS